MTIVGFAEADLLRSKWASHKELEAERVAVIGELEKSAAEGKTAEEKKVGDARAAVFAELEESLSPELAPSGRELDPPKSGELGPGFIKLARAGSPLSLTRSWQ